MKVFLTSVFILFSVVSIAQNLLLSEDFDYPIGSTLNKYNWTPLTSATDNPIKIVGGLSKDGSSVSGGAAYLNKNGQDVKRAFASITDNKIFLKFQFNYKTMQKIPTYGGVSCSFYNGSNNKLNSSNYFMFLSSKEEPTKPLIKFSLYASWCAGGLNHLIVRDSQEKTIAGILLDFNELFPWNPENNSIVDIEFEYNLKGPQAGKAIISSPSKILFVLTPYDGGIVESQTKINNLSNIVLSQSDINVGSKVIVDGIRISKSKIISQAKEINEDPLNSTFNVTVFPNTTDGNIDLLINDKVPEGELEVKLADNIGNDLFQNIGNWVAIKPEIEQILSKNKAGQYYFTVKQGEGSKTIRVVRQE